MRYLILLYTMTTMFVAGCGLADDPCKNRRPEEVERSAVRKAEMNADDMCAAWRSCFKAEHETTSQASDLESFACGETVWHPYPVAPGRGDAVIWVNDPGTVSVKTTYDYYFDTGFEILTHEVQSCYCEDCTRSCSWERADICESWQGGSRG